MQSRPAIWLETALLAALALPLVAFAAPPAQNPLAELEQGGLGSLAGLDDFSPPVTVEAHFLPAADGNSGELTITAIIEAPYHIYSLTQPAGGPIPTSIRLDPSDAYTLSGDFRPTPAPSTHVDQEIWEGLTIEEHAGQVTWKADVRLTPGTDLNALDIRGLVTTQACDPSSCQDLTINFRAETILPAQPVASPRADGVDRPQGSVGSYQKAGSNVSLSGRLEPANVAPGGTAELVITASVTPGWHVYERLDRDPQDIGGKPTLIALAPAAGITSYKPQTESKVHVESQAEFNLPDNRYYEQDVTWRTRIEVADDLQPGTYPLRGAIGIQTCKDTTCEMPQGVQFEVPLQVGGAEPRSSEAPLTFTEAGYSAAASLAKSSPIPPSPPGAAAAGDESTSSNFSLPFVLLLALGGGLILNLMPCVLPVIGLKVLAFATQGGASRSRVMGLNLTFAAGLISVFLLLATLASLAQLGLADESLDWGELFTLSWFKIALTCLVFSMALSFLGVWELPIPGFASSGTAVDLSAQEGYSGAFFKGVFSTILATPCSGPLLGVVFGYTLTQSPAVTYLVFTTIGLGMALPYILIGLEPKLIAWLPKPGAWMDTFKQLMAFPLLGTVVFLMSAINDDLVIPTFALLTAIWFTCWWIGRIPATASADRKAFAWLGGTALSGIVMYFGLIVTPIELPWSDWSPQAQRAARSEGKTVLVDFTADWCPTCKWNLKVAINTEEVKSLVKENGVVPLLADYTDRSDAIKSELKSLKSRSIPLLAIYPPGPESEPIVLRDLVSKEDVIAALRQAGPSLAAPAGSVPSESQSVTRGVESTAATPGATESAGKL